MIIFQIIHMTCLGEKMHPVREIIKRVRHQHSERRCFKFPVIRVPQANTWNDVSADAFFVMGKVIVPAAVGHHWVDLRG